MPPDEQEDRATPPRRGRWAPAAAAAVGAATYLLHQPLEAQTGLPFGTLQAPALAIAGVGAATSFINSLEAATRATARLFSALRDAIDEFDLLREKWRSRARGKRWLRQGGGRGSAASAPEPPSRDPPRPAVPAARDPAAVEAAMRPEIN